MINRTTTKIDVLAGDPGKHIAMSRRAISKKYTNASMILAGTFFL